MDFKGVNIHKYAQKTDQTVREVGSLAHLGCHPLLLNLHHIDAYHAVIRVAA